MRKRLRSHEGANAVEFALVLPMLVVLIFGGIWGGIALNHDMALSTAAREGARFAATYNPTPPPPDPTWIDAVIERVVQESNGSLGANVDSGVVCVAFVDASDTVTARRRTWLGGTPSTSGTPDCSVNDGLTGSGQTRVHVTTARESDIQAILLNIPVTVHSEAVARYEEVD